jgi:thymidylate kinase
MQLITISGLDGSGKTTQINKLKKYLEGEKKRVYFFHIITFSIANKYLGKKKSALTPAKAITSATPLAIILRKFALIIDAFRFTQFMHVLKMNNLYDYVLTDRYFYDQIVNIRYLEKSSQQETIPFWQRITEKLMKQPTKSFFMKVSPEVATSRDREVEQGKQFLIDKQAIFDKFMKHWGIQIIHGENSPGEVFAEIINEINKK